MGAEAALKQRFQPDGYPMLGDTVSEGSGEYFTGSWSGDDEAKCFAWLIGAVMDFTYKPPQVTLEVSSIFTTLFSPEFVPQAIKIGINPPFFLLITKRDHRPHGPGIVLIVVVVDLAIPAMEIPRVRSVKR